MPINKLNTEGGFPISRDYWNEPEYGSNYESDEYNSIMHIPFTERTIEIGFVDGSSKVITYDESDKFANPKKEKLQSCSREKYYKFRNISRSYPDGKDAKTGVLEIRLDNRSIPEIVVTGSNITYIEPEKEREMVAVISAQVIDKLYSSIMKWELKSINSIERVPKESISELTEKYPTEGAIPEYISTL